MESIAEVAKSNVAATGEVTNATEEMARLAAELQEIVARFRLAGRQTGEGEKQRALSAHLEKSGLKAAGCMA